MKTVWKVNIIESERGWGQKIDETLYFRDRHDADMHIKQFNSRNTAATAPDWYMRAEGPYKVKIPDEKDIH